MSRIVLAIESERL